jgi:thiamine-phosphate pyrophosphorylase
MSGSLPRLYAICDPALSRRRGADPIQEAALCLRAGALTLWREPAAPIAEVYEATRALAEIIGPLRSSLIVHDRLDLALAIDAGGVHRSASRGLPVEELRRALGPGRWLIASAHSPEEASTYLAQGADVAVLGPIFETPSKPGYGPALGAQALGLVQGKVFGLGGVTPERVASCRGAGGYGVAVMGGLFAREGVEAAARAYLDALSDFDALAGLAF